ncbi:helix-turn-helix transcriptional regulator [Roseovarius faecimaris]|uniref:Helix-turn-helix transcriptional regulator n=1 Tax=Roseovarius faecimaris TaxID=2494550 RepID=A0A6I6IRI4_9RHOB|nr:helix-turn-helix transcriptional regulator [Roseovarius faecimaris]QGX98694.1 helix-turn-helix transcriptional regulator [Roseovarius faecimaris]
MKPTASDRPAPLIALIAVQALCAAFFVLDVLSDVGPDGLRALANLHIAIEAAAALGLVAAVIFETRYLLALLRRKAHLEHQVSIAAGAFNDVLLEHFERWKLTPAERDVAIFTIKGFSVAEVADLRGSAEGTIKSQLNAVYRKADVSGRGALLGLLVDDLIAAPLVTAADAVASPQRS